MSDHPALRDAILVIPGVKQGLFSQPEIRDRLIKTGHLTETPDDRNRLNQNVVRLKKSELLKVRPARNGADEAVRSSPYRTGVSAAMRGNRQRRRHRTRRRSSR